jgi:hypothetical protein
MNRDDIIAMAREAEGIQFNYRPSEEFVYFAERFAALIKQHLSYDSIHTCHAECQRPACVAVREAVKAEREACAQLCDEYVVPVSIEGAHPDYLIGKQMAFQQAAQAIRARGEK